MIHLGIDVAKDEIVVHDGERVFAVRNRAKEIRALLEAYPEPGSLALEATGGYERETLALAHAAGWRAFLLQPAWVKAHARASGGRAKTDAVDAKAIRGYLLAREGSLRPWAPLPEGTARLQAALRQRQRLGDDVARLRTRYRALGLDEALLKVALAGLEAAKKALDKELAALLKEEPRAKALLAVPGVGPQTTAAVLVALGKGEFPRGESLVAFAGLDPMARDSGKSQGARRISKRGDETLRRALFMAAMAASRLDAWKARYQAHKDKGMPPTKALVALARKIAVVLHALAHSGAEFDPRKVALKAKPA